MLDTELRKLIRDVPDFPEPGIIFKDITPLLARPDALTEAIDALAGPFIDSGVTQVAGIEARGFIFAAPVARTLGTGFIPIRKAGKLPYDVVHREYDLEYGTDRVEIHSDALTTSDTVLIVDDVLATGGTGRATLDLITDCGATVAGVSVLIELGFLNGRERLGATNVHAVITYGAS